MLGNYSRMLLDMGQHHKEGHVTNEQLLTPCIHTGTRRNMQLIEEDGKKEEIVPIYLPRGAKWLMVLAH